eukprot:gene13866-15314_t
MTENNKSNRIRIVVSGENYELYESRLTNYPDTLLGNPALRSKHRDPVCDVYFFDRHRLAFEGILLYYQSNGKIICPDNVPYEVFQDELKFFGIKECTVSEKAKAFILDPFHGQFSQYAATHGNRFKTRIWLMLQDPQSSMNARIFSLFSLIVTLLSIVLGVMTKVETQHQGMYSNLFPYEMICFAGSPSNPFCDSGPVSILRVFRLANIFRIFKLTRYSYGLRLLLYTVYKSRLDLQILGACLCFFIVITASLMYHAEIYEPNSPIDSIPNAVWWAVVTCTT